MSEQDWKQLQYYQEDFLASHSVQPGSAEARKMTVTSGLKCSELYRRSDPVGSLVRMLLESSAWRSTRCYLTWKVSATPAKRLLFRLVPSMPHIGETAAPFWPTPTTPRPHDSENTAGKYIPSQKQKDLSYAVAMWPTPSASDCGRTAINPILTSNGTIRHRNKAGGQSYARLDAVAALFATPQARDFRTGQAERWQDPRRSKNLNDQVAMFPTPRVGGSNGNSPAGDKHGDLAARVGGQLNPTWVEWLMGFPSGWTDLSASETQSCPSSSSHSLMR